MNKHQKPVQGTYRIESKKREAKIRHAAQHIAEGAEIYAQAARDGHKDLLVELEETKMEVVRSQGRKGTKRLAELLDELRKTMSPEEVAALYRSL